MYGRRVQSPQSQAKIDDGRCLLVCLIATPSGSADTPRVRFLVLVVQRFQPLVLLELAELRGVREAEEGRCKLYQPFRIDRGHLAHVLLRRLDELVIDYVAEGD